MKKRIAVMASGNGSNFQALVDAMTRYPDYEVVLCISDNQEAYALKRAQEAGITAFSFSPKSFDNKAAYEVEIVRHLKEWKIDFIVLAGYLRLVGQTLLQSYEGRIINVHPSLLPSFPGLHAVQQALEAGVKITGMTIHFVDAGMDTGPIIVQKAVNIHESDDVHSLTARIQKLEHEWYPRVLSWLCNDQLSIRGRHVMLTNHEEVM